ncbi:CdaR family protein [Salinibacillus xinjiangensis]|uniref:YbbR-like domain-containing protein n=1 Tax=Salinibacillus xinjiangensis TaxID=1229268 RepID=A0A6G1XBS4_9BACI|nr:CdaR family protein [Salinibacillus xinjiangensis]MRG88355.1 hypothetical protein [Salinibacillus xinjiangensis]
MDNWLRSPWVIRGISLLLAVALYISVSLSEDNANGLEDTLFPSGSSETVTMNSIPLQVRINEEKYVVKGVPQYVNVSIEGSKSAITSTERVRSFDVFIDLEGLEPGTHEVNVQHAGFSNNLSVFIEPETVEVEIEERLTKEYKVDTELMNRDQINEGYILGEPTVKPATVKVTGGKSEVDKTAMVKAIVDLTGVEDEIDIDNAPVKVYDQQGNELNVYVDPSTVGVEIPVEVGRKEVPLQVSTEGELPEGLSLQSITANPEVVAVFGQESVLNSIENISNLSVNLAAISEDKTVELEVPIPPGATKVEPSTVEVEVNVEETQEKIIDEIPIQVENLEDGRDVTFISPENGTINLKVSGTAEQLEEITAENFVATIDVEGFYEGEFETEIKISNPEEYVITSNYNNARVRIE